MSLMNVGITRGGGEFIGRWLIFTCVSKKMAGLAILTK